MSGAFALRSLCFCSAARRGAPRRCCCLASPRARSPGRADARVRVSAAGAAVGDDGGAVVVLRCGTVARSCRALARGWPAAGCASARVGRSLLLKTRGLGLRGGLRAASIPLEAPGRSFPAVVARAVPRTACTASTRATRFRDDREPRRGRCAVRRDGGPPSRSSWSREREEDGAWRVAFADLRGPPLSASAHGRVLADGRLALRVRDLAARSRCCPRSRWPRYPPVRCRSRPSRRHARAADPDAARRARAVSAPGTRG
jgi:hypothetical protein